MGHIKWIFTVLCSAAVLFCSAGTAAAAQSDAAQEKLVVGVPADRSPVFYRAPDTNEIIGASELFEQARLLEIAGKDKDRDFIKEHHGQVLALYRSYRKLLADIHA